MKSRFEPARKWLIFRMLFIGMDVVAGVLCMLPGLHRTPLCAASAAAQANSRNSKYRAY